MISRIKKYASLQVLLLPLLGLTPIPSHADVSVIANKGISVDSITTKQAKKLWLGKLKKLAGIRITVMDQPSDKKVSEDFYLNVVKKKPSQLKAYWAKISFTGKGFPPKKLKDDAAIINWVANTPGALGYVDSTAVNDSVKSLLTAK